METVSIEYSLAGKILAEDVHNNFGLLLLPSGTLLDDANITLLLTHKVERVSILRTKEYSAERYSSVFSQHAIEKNYGEAGKQYVHALQQTKELFQQFSQGPVPSLIELIKYFYPLMDNVLEKVGFLHLLHEIEGADDYTYRHSVNVGLLAALIAKLLKFPQEEVILIGQTGLLHDVGKMLVPSEILLKAGKLTDDEFEIMKQHTTWGVHLLRASGITDETILSGTLLHHERLDGSGYPEGRKEPDIPYYVQILSVADVFDALSADRVYRKRLSPFEAAKTVSQLTFQGQLNPEIVTPFIHYILQFYIGAEAILSNGEQAEVVMIHKDEPLRPLVRIGEEYVDLRIERSLIIEQLTRS
ncbi:HD-GYP domain-containing protein [Brevibacillus fulvus]|uniref:Nucleotidyltransferase with HDIG domain n=1 Tax=Brevibacillus fulvus TaxID=1125967 RepID=A0A938XVY5_9BACL|nr:HD-GYP domain-containing protein [Brevibacillus fulvus]MBM7591473.1 putative nucleotidyltransferase with HDIG domain [Brevibacillus fulvus]